MVEPSQMEPAHVSAAGVLASRATIEAEWVTAAGRPDNSEFSDPREVHVWVCDLNVSMSELDRFKKVLAPNEVARSARFHFDRHRNHYIASHGFLREVIAHYLSVAPGNVQFEHTSRGKPLLAAFTNTGGLQFNLAHSNALAVIGISPRARIGVDVELVRQLP